MPDEPFHRLVTPRAVLVGFILCMAVALGVAAVTSPAPFGPYNPGWDGTSTVRETIDTTPSETPVVVETTAYSRVDANGTLVIILAPRTSYSATDVAQIQRFLDRGGTVLIAEDRRIETNQLLARLGASTRIDGRPVRDPQTFYRDPSLPVVTNLTNTSLTRDVESITLNGGTVLQPGNATTVAQSSEFAYLDRNGNAELDSDEQFRAYPIATRERIGDGQLFVLSDPSVFINRMVERDGNRQLVVQSAASHDRVIMDFSHRPGAPPAAVLWLWVRRTPWAQAFLGLVGSAMALAVISERVQGQLQAAVGTVLGGGSDITSVTLSRAEMRRVLHKQHPEWDGERIERITESINHLPEDTPSKTDE
jgi:hypothetical protein